ncbi:hypothetical protein MTR_3g025200 [Medicago truncatula]|uniref:Uncharacterized protein n=1 Tax=Medicago truncatula TaxID=3880 RepID=G7IWE2_MEDTR|nr:hypothetical protein MTR_3g025200 [Medicago truncatula]
MSGPWRDNEQPCESRCSNAKQRHINSSINSSYIIREPDKLITYQGDCVAPIEIGQILIQQLRKLNNIGVLQNTHQFPPHLGKQSTSHIVKTTKINHKEEASVLLPYDEVSNPCDNLKIVDTPLSFTGARGLVKCKLFVLTLHEEESTWFNALMPRSIDSLNELSMRFTTHFTAIRK